MKDLAGFPLAMVVADTAINAQLASVYSKTHDLPDSWELPEEPVKGDPDYQAKLDDYNNAGWHLKVDKFGPPQVDFNTHDLSSQGCRLILPIESGSFTTYAVIMKSGKPTVEEVPIKLDGIKIYATTQINTIRHDQFSDADFTVQALYADLSQVARIEFETSDDIQVQALGTIKSSLQTVIQNKLQDIGAKNPTALLFGSVKIPTLQKSAAIGVLAPKAFTYSVIHAQDEHTSGSLCYMLWTGDPATMPVGNEAGRLNYNFARYANEAVLMIAGSVWLEHFIVPAFTATYPNLNFTITPGDVNNVVNAQVNPSGEVDEKAYNAALAKAVLTDNASFSADGLTDPVFTKMNLVADGEAVMMDYEFKFKHKVMALYQHYTASGENSIIVTTKDNKLDIDVSNWSTKVKADGEDFWTDFAQGLGLAFSLGFATFGYLDDQQAALDTGKGKIGPSSSVSAVLGLIELPGRAVFTFGRSMMQMGQVLITCRYASDQATGA